MKLLLLSVVIACSYSAWAQFDDSPIPLRLAVSGSVPIQQQRPTGFRQARIHQQQPSSHEQGQIRLRRPGAVRGPSYKSVDASQTKSLLQSLEDSSKPVTEEADDNKLGSSPSPLFGPNLSLFNQRPQLSLHDLEDDDFPSFLSNPTSTSARPQLNLQTFFNTEALIPDKLELEPKPQQILKPSTPNSIPQSPIYKQPQQNYQQQLRPVEHARPVEHSRPVEYSRPEPQRPQPARIQPLSHRPSRPQYRPDPKDSEEEEDDEPIQPVRQYNRAPEHAPRPQVKTQVRPAQQPAPQRYNHSNREKKPVAQTLRKYKDENEDGSITWGYENDDGSYKKETIGIDCVTRGEYGYVDPDGLERKYAYETGIPCDKTQPQQEEKGFIDYHENKAVLPNGVVIDLEAMGRKKSKRPFRAAQNAQIKY